MTKILLSGCNGRMGRAVTALCGGSREAVIAAGIDVNAERNADYPVYANPSDFAGAADVAVDFSRIETLDALLPYCLRRNIPLVLCTTGYDEERFAKINAASERLPIFLSGNMSYGVAVLADLAERAAKALSNYDIEIIERHHNQKLDAPSGTAAMLYKAVSSAGSAPVHDRHTRRQTRDKREIGIHSVRGGTIVGEHEILFAGHHETITLTHRADSRELFADGALRAAKFMSGGVHEAGLYGMRDLIN
ncbi:4-hydroxy-tetrahydrodipicolinate reductase [Clostridia bacterium]|nr:4-hydroxy-tetrahydrodipicolinate reductase [Clostridia bacterium]